METQATPPLIDEQSPRTDIYSIVNNRIIALLEQGIVPWRQPWNDVGIPRNFVSRRPYRGINLMLLSTLGYEDNQFLTYNQLHAIGGRVREGERPHLAVFWKYLEVSVKDQHEQEAEAVKRNVAYLRFYLLYNIAQCEGLPGSAIPTVVWSADPIPTCEAICESMPQRPLIKHGREQRAYYHPLLDYVNMPKFQSIESAESDYATLFHELVHSTGHASRLGRKDLPLMEEFNPKEAAYSIEELVAEIGSCYLLSFAGITSELGQGAAYIGEWLKRLRNDKRFIFSASTQAQRAADFILNLPSENEVNKSNKPDISRA